MVFSAIGFNASLQDTGTVRINSHLPLPYAPTIIFEWVSLVPLVIYLASFSYAPKLVGRTALGGSIIAASFPKIGAIRLIVRLLDEGFDFLDRACSISKFRRELWDVIWGSEFPCANGSVFGVLTKTILQKTDRVIKTTVESPIHLARVGDIKTHKRETTTSFSENYA
jgi:hypothetical protein